MKKIALAGAAVLALTVTAQSQADHVGVYAGAYAWQTDLSGDAELNKHSFDLNSDDNSNSFYVAIEHPLPFLPNLRLQRTNLSLNSTASKLDLSHTDATFYYNIIDNWVHFDLGVTGRIFDGKLDDGIHKSSIDETVPLLYGNAMIELPYNLYAGATGNVTHLGDNDIYDLSAHVGWRAILGLGVEAGYRTFSVKMDDLKHAEVNSTVKGPYLGLSYHF